MANKVQHKRSNVAGTAPTAAQVAVGELAMNFVDKKLYTQEPGGTIIEFGGGASSSSLNYYTADAAWVKPSSGTFARVTCVGAGGGGASNSSSTGQAGGGLGGSVATAVFLLSALPATVSMTIGAGGAGGANANGVSGAATAFGTELVASGGSGGAKGSVGNIPYTGALTVVSANGRPVVSFENAISIMAHGADKPISGTASAKGNSTAFGSGGASSIRSSGNGLAGVKFGSGGGAGFANGGAGSAGIIIVEVM